MVRHFPVPHFFPRFFQIQSDSTPSLDITDMTGGLAQCDISVELDIPSVDFVACSCEMSIDDFSSLFRHGFFRLPAQAVLNHPGDCHRVGRLKYERNRTCLFDSFLHWGC